MRTIGQITHGRSVVCTYPDGSVHYLYGLVGIVNLLQMQTCVLLADAIDGWRMPVGTRVRFV